MKFILTFALVFGCLLSLSGQHQKVLHQSFHLDSLQEVTLSLHDKYQVEPWAGDAVLFETTVKLYDATSGILEYLIENDRYKIEADTNLATFGLSLFSVDKERRIIKTKKGECFEEVEVRVFLPDNFVKTDTHTWKKPEEEKKGEESPTPQPTTPVNSIQPDSTQIKQE